MPNAEEKLMQDLKAIDTTKLVESLKKLASVLTEVGQITSLEMIRANLILLSGVASMKKDKTPPEAQKIIDDFFEYNKMLDAAWNKSHEVIEGVVKYTKE